MNALPFEIEDWGLTDYDEAWTRQIERVAQIIEGARSPVLVLTEHHPVLTLGASYHEENLLQTEAALAQQGIQVCRTDRGGDITYHGPGQLVAYPLFPLDWVNRDLHRWLRELEEIVIQTIGAYGVAARRFAPHTGVWVGDRKVCAMGIKVRRWVSLHGLALNCNVDLVAFDSIIPCGIQGYGVTSLTRETGNNVLVSDAKTRLIEAFANRFAQMAPSVV